MKKLLFITTRLFWPIDSGRKASLYYYCKGLHDVYGYEIYLYSFFESGQTHELIKSKPYFIKEIKPALQIKKSTKILNLFTKSLFQGWPFQNSIFFSNENARAIKEYAEVIHPDIIFVDMIRLAPYYEAIKDFDCKKILDMDDLLSVRYFCQAENNSAKGKIFGAYSGELSKGESQFVNNGFIRKIILFHEAKRVRRAELKYGNLYDKVIFVSDRETHAFNQMTGSQKAVTVRLGVDTGNCVSDGGEHKEKGAIGFLGNLRYGANTDSLEIISKQILCKLNFDYRLYIVGNAPEDVRAMYSDNPNMIFCGRVENPSSVLSKCSVFLSPIAYGTGIKTKILEAMALGLPVVTNSMGVEGIDGENGVHYIVEDDPQAMAKAVEELVADSEKAEYIGKSAEELVKKYYNWGNIYEEFAQIL